MKSTSKAAAGPRPGLGARRGHPLPRAPAGRRPAAARARPPRRPAAHRRSKQFELAAANCEGGRLPATRLHLPDEGSARARPGGRRAGTERGYPADVEGEQICGRFASCASSTTSSPSPRRAISRRRRGAQLARRGCGYDPQVVDAALAEPGVLLGAGGCPRRLGALPSQPSPSRWRRSQSRGPEMVARALPSSPISRSVSCADTRPGSLNWPPPRPRLWLLWQQLESSEVRAAGLFHDLGRVSVPNGIWEKPGPLERGRVGGGSPPSLLHRAGAGALPGVGTAALLAGSHHERLDGSGYHRGPPPLNSASAPGCWQPPTPLMR